MRWNGPRVMSLFRRFIGEVCGPMGAPGRSSPLPSLMFACYRFGVAHAEACRLAGTMTHAPRPGFSVRRALYYRRKFDEERGSEVLYGVRR